MMYPTSAPFYLPSTNDSLVDLYRDEDTYSFPFHALQVFRVSVSIANLPIHREEYEELSILFKF